MYGNTEWTNNEASRSKLALNELGYIEDRFVGFFTQMPLKRTPEINRGYYSRVYAIAHSVETFCRREGATAQIVNIGSGFDTLFWRLKSNTFSTYVDVDSTDVVEHKIRAIKQHPELLEPCGTLNGQSNTSNFHSDRYHAIAQDATKGRQLIDKLVNKCAINRNQPILFIFECVLLYWSEEARTNLFYALNKQFTNCNIVIFDIVNTMDKFSSLMQQSLYESNTPLLGANSTRTLEDWNQQLQRSGARHVQSWLMTEVYQKLIDQNEKSKIERIEFLDEIELLFQLFNHYCLILASNNSPTDW
ncbi:Leucine carboxyl methyltransferase 1 [Blomia tropicalis]|nr:Leucine carboxyl methyltransferase 1 [Blomia tropicalis]